MGTYCYVAVRRGRLGGARRFGADRGRGAGHIAAAARLQLVTDVIVTVTATVTDSIRLQY